jgi:feruloyl esterase
MLLQSTLWKGRLVFNFARSSDTFDILKKLRGTNPLKDPPRRSASAGRAGTIGLRETRDFGANPGQLRMFSYVPFAVQEQAPLVVVLHGCGQTAAAYDHGAGWSTLADRYGFALLMPEQQRTNKPNGCFNWFRPEDTRRGRGEAASIRLMVETMVRKNDIDPGRIFVTGLSAGGAMTSVMLACYPETFAAGAIIAGLPYGAASDVQQALQSMFHCPSRPARDWGELVRAAAPRHEGPWPRISVWHGSADNTVVPSNAREILKQWTDVHGLSDAPSKEVTVKDYPRKVWLNEAGDEVVESYTITHMAHGTPVAAGEADFECGAAGPFLLEVGISSSFHIAQFFGLTLDGAVTNPSQRTLKQTPVSGTSEFTQCRVLRDEISDADLEHIPPRPTRSRIDIGAVIAKALETAGLIPRK